jgi:hypothetical protein
LLLCNVYLQFTPARRKLVRTPQSGQRGVSVVLEGVESLSDPQLVLVCVVRNPGATRLDLSISVGGQVLRRTRISPRRTSRIDVAWPRPVEIPRTYSVNLVGTGGTWTLEYLELANLHGFTRGWVNFLILPARQQFGLAPVWSLVVLATCALAVSKSRWVPWPRWLRAAWLLLATMIASTFFVVAVSPVVSPFRVVLSAGTFVLGLLVLAAPRVTAMGRHVWMTSDFVDRRLKVVPWPLVLAVVAMGAYVLFLGSRVGAYAGGADSSGYLNSARLLGDARVRTSLRVVAGIPAAELRSYAYVPLGFRPRGDGEMAPTYPIGLPIAVLATASFTGWDLAPHVTMVCHALLGVGLMYWLGWAVGLPRGWAALGTLMLATSPQYLFSSLTLMSDTPAMVWSTVAVLLAWYSRTDARWAAVAGAVLATAVLVRPTNILVLAPVAVCLGLSLRRWTWLCAGGAPGAVLLLLYNLSAYGHALETGYGDTRRLFRLANVPASLNNYLAWFPVVLTPIVVLAAGLPVLWRRSPRLVAMLVLWISPFCIVYAFYYHTHETWWYLRFLLPVFPPLIAGALLVGRRLLDLWPTSLSPNGIRNRSVLAGLVIGASILSHNLVWGGRLHATEVGRGERVYVEVTDWARTHLPRNSVIIAMQTTGAFFFYTEFPILRWDSLDRGTFHAIVTALEARGQPLYAVLFPSEVERRVLIDKLPGEWTLVGTVRYVTIWRFDGSQTDVLR